MKKIKKLIIPCILILVIFLIPIFSISYIITKNNNFTNSLKSNIKNNYKTSEKINYVNKYGNYYIFKTANEVIVLNEEYEEITKEKISNIAKNVNNYELIYKTNKLLYENTKRTKNKVIYEYYDIKNYKKLSEITMEQ